MRAASLTITQTGAVIAAALVAAGCGSTTKTSAYPSGYPKRVPIASVPERMSEYSGKSEGAHFAVAVAPGVWVREAAGVSVHENAADGSPFGWCAAVKKWANGRGSTCW